jgi:hypothetical protein
LAGIVFMGAGGPPDGFAGTVFIGAGGAPVGLAGTVFEGAGGGVPVRVAPGAGMFSSKTRRVVLRFGTTAVKPNEDSSPVGRLGVAVGPPPGGAGGGGAPAGDADAPPACATVKGFLQFAHVICMPTMPASS